MTTQDVAARPPRGPAPIHGVPSNSALPLSLAPSSSAAGLHDHGSFLEPCGPSKRPVLSNWLLAGLEVYVFVWVWK